MPVLIVLVNDWVPLVSDYERDRIRVTAEMVVRIAEALELSADELLGMKRPKSPNGSKASRRVLRRVERVEQLPPQQQATLLRTIDAFLKAAEKQKAQRAAGLLNTHCPGSSTGGSLSVPGSCCVR
jgi:transcriptional regulator with XRE-family HTH domain